jgi:hypothetical protein
LRYETLVERRHPTEKMSLTDIDDLVLYVGPRARSGVAIEWLEREVLALRSRDGKERRGAYIHVVLTSHDRDGLIDDDTRRAMLHFVKACTPKFQAGAVVLEQAGFVGAAVRSVVSAVLLAARPEIPVKMFATGGEAGTWLAGKGYGRIPSAERIDAQVRKMRDEMGLGD